MSDGEYERSGTSLPLARRAQGIVDYVAAGLAVVTGGASEIVAPAIRRVVQGRIDGLRETILNDLAAGAITESTLIKEDDLASFIIRIQRSALEGCAKRKLRLMSAYFFRRSSAPEYTEDMFLTFAGITEQLTQPELKALAVIKADMLGGKVVQVPLTENDEPPSRRIDKDPELLGLFTDRRDFVAAVTPLMRFGFVEAASGWGTLVYYATDSLFEYLESIDLELLKPGAW